MFLLEKLTDFNQNRDPSFREPTINNERGRRNNPRDGLVSRPPPPEEDQSFNHGSKECSLGSTPQNNICHAAYCADGMVANSEFQNCCGPAGRLGNSNHESSNHSGGGENEFNRDEVSDTQVEFNECDQVDCTEEAGQGNPCCNK